jgi:hypothetical protein
VRLRERWLTVAAVSLVAVLVAASSCAQRATKPVAQPAAASTGAAEAKDGDTPPGKFPTPSGQCIFLRTINDWKAADPYRILVRTKVSGWQWEVLLDRRCSDLFYANALKWDTPDSRVCDYRRDAITVPRDRCIITAIRPYEEPAERAPAKAKPNE